MHPTRKLEKHRDGSTANLKQPIDALLDRTRYALQTVPRFSRDLRPPLIDDLGLVAGIDMVVEKTNGIVYLAQALCQGDNRRN